MTSVLTTEGTLILYGQGLPQQQQQTPFDLDLSNWNDSDFITKIT